MIVPADDAGSRSIGRRTQPALDPRVEIVLEQHPALHTQAPREIEPVSGIDFMRFPLPPQRVAPEARGGRFVAGVTGEQYGPARCCGYVP